LGQRSEILTSRPADHRLRSRALAAGSLTTRLRADAGAGSNYPFLTQKERDIETGLDYFLVLAAHNYWNPPEDEGSRWLYEGVLPAVRQFLIGHQSHLITFGEEEEFAPIQRDDYFDWMQIGYLAKPTPRYLVETLAFTSWDQVREYIGRQKIPPAWWEVTWIDPSPHERAKEKFEELVRQKQRS
jgi:hypothetical protein